MTERFEEHVKNIREYFPVEKAVLLLRHYSGSLAAIATWDKNHVHDGLSITLPPNSSLFEKVVISGEILVSNECRNFEGNFFEKKLLLNENSQSFILQPLKIGDYIVALIGYSSSQPLIYDSHELNKYLMVSEDFSKTIASFIDKIAI